VSREVAAGETVVLTVGSIRAGAKSNIIPSEAELRLNVRTYDEAVRERVLAAIDRIVRAESAASDAPKDPEIEPYDVFPLTVNDEAATERVAAALRDALGAENTIETDPVMGSEDFGLFGKDAQVPSVFWFFGGMDPKRYADAKARGRVTQEIPSNHSPFFAPDPEPTIVNGVRCMTTVALDWLEG
jgi:hippurate hydrolase